VTAFVYTYEAPIKQTTTTTAALTATDTAVKVASLKNLDVKPGSYIGVTAAAGGAVTVGDEYMLVTEVKAADLELTVVRGATPPGLTNVAATTPASGANVFLVPRSYSTVQFQDSLSKTAIETGTGVGTDSGANNLISTSMRAIVELSPREPIVWVVPAEPEPSARLVRDIIHQGLTLEDFESPSARRATTQEYEVVLARLLELTPPDETVTVSDPRGDVTVTVERVCDSKAVCDEKWAKLQQLICNGELAKELTALFKKDVKIDGKLNGCPDPTLPAEGNLLLLLLLLLLIPLGIAAYYCSQQEEVPPTGKPMAPVYLPQPYPVLPVEYAPVAAPMPLMQMSPQPIAIEYAQAPMPMPVMQMSPQPVMMAPIGGSPVPYGMQQAPMQYGM